MTIKTTWDPTWAETEIARLTAELEQARGIAETGQAYADNLTAELERARAEMRPEVMALARAMERKLRANDYRPGWRGETRGWLLKRLRQETAELAEALALEWSLRFGGRTEDAADMVAAKAAVLDECADVANFAMMLADKCCVLSPQPDDLADK
jgi:NTP pyrophosphatase (non-canonical NTP hydrolase)